MTKKEIFQKLNQQDWWFQWSDDPIVYNAGYETLVDLLTILRAEAKTNIELSNTIKEWYQEIQKRYIEEYIPHGIVKEFIND
jgi:hypothetical protein